MKTITLKKIAATALSFAVLSSFAGCSATEETTAAAGTTAGSSAEDTTAAEEQTAESVTITVGASITPHTEILEIAKPILAEQGITLEIVPLEDYITPINCCKNMVH